MNEMRRNVKKRPAVKKVFALLLALSMFCALLAGCGKKEETDNVTVRVGAMSGPTAMGMVKLMQDAENGETANTYNVTMYGTADEITAGIANKTIDIANVPCNLASVLYNKTEGGIKILDINTLGVLYVVETGESIQSVEDLKGKTIYSTGKGTTPEFALNYILRENGIDPETDVTIEYKSEATEVAAALAEADAAIEKYYVHVTKTSSLAMEVLMAGGLEAFKKEVMPTKGEYTGPQTIRKTGLAAGTSYSVCVLGISKSGSDFWIEKTQKTEKAE